VFSGDDVDDFLKDLSLIDFVKNFHFREKY